MTRVCAAITTTALVAFGVLVSASPVLAGSGSVAGTVTDESPSHNPLSGIRVCFSEPKGATEEACASTDAAGHYTLVGLNPGAYVVSFRAQPGQNLITQYFDGAATYVDADPVAVGSGPVAGVDAEMHEGGTIAGAALTAGSAAPIAGLSVCAYANGGLYSGCATTDAIGRYSITGLPAESSYHVEFTASGDLNYLAQSYAGKEGLDYWDPVAVAVGATTAGIDAAMNPGAQIAGTVTEAGTAAPVGGIEVCALDPAGTPRAEEFERCAFTDAAGNYAIRSLPAGTYVVVFSRSRGIDADGYAPQYFAGVATAAEASRITIAPPDRRTGINAGLVHWVPWPKEPERIIVTLIQRAPAKPPLRCRKHFHRKKTRGKVRCVKNRKRPVRGQDRGSR